MRRVPYLCAETTVQDPLNKTLIAERIYSISSQQAKPQNHILVFVVMALAHMVDNQIESPLRVPDPNQVGSMVLKFGANLSKTSTTCEIFERRKPQTCFVLINLRLWKPIRVERLLRN